MAHTCKPSARIEKAGSRNAAVRKALILSVLSWLPASTRRLQCREADCLRKGCFRALGIMPGSSKKRSCHRLRSMALV